MMNLSAADAKAAVGDSRRTEVVRDITEEKSKEGRWRGEEFWCGI